MSQVCSAKMFSVVQKNYLVHFGGKLYIFGGKVSAILPSDKNWSLGLQFRGGGETKLTLWYCRTTAKIIDQRFRARGVLRPKFDMARPCKCACTLTSTNIRQPENIMYISLLNFCHSFNELVV